MAKRQLHKLSAREAETIAEPGRHSDGGGLYLVIETGAHTRRQWIFLYRVRGTSKRRELGLGPAKGKAKDGLSLADARLKAADARKKLADGKDPAAERRAEKAASVTFGEFADALLKSIKSGFKGKKTHRDWKRDLEVRCKPIRSKALQEISATDVLNILLPMWLTINPTARETRSRIERVFMAARAKGLHSGENPAMWRGNLKELLPKARRTKRHHAAAPYKHVPDIVRALQERHKTANTDVNLAAEFIVLTAVRTGEARFMRVREVDFEEKLWTVPAERMKTEDDPEGSCFEVPLSERAVAILEAVVPNGAPPDAYVFAGQWSGNGEKPLGMNAVLHALKAVYPTMTTHGCRSSFRDWAGDETTYERDIAEMALAHKVGNEVEQAYRRGNTRSAFEIFGSNAGQRHASDLIAGRFPGLPRHAQHRALAGAGMADHDPKIAPIRDMRQRVGLLAGKDKAALFGTRQRRFAVRVTHLMAFPFRHEFGRRVRKVMVVALARKLLVALWRFVIDGVMLEGAVMKPSI